MTLPDRAWVGKVLSGRWRIDGFIAQGGVATVFRASDSRGHPVAVKIMHPHFADNLDARGRFLREGYAANRVDHPGVVRVLDSAVSDGLPYIVMELLANGELLEHRREKLGGALPVVEVVMIADQLLDVLASAHEKGIIHRDIKPDNLFLLADGTLKVLDFGIAQIREAAIKAEPTATGLLLGTPDFMSPEQALGIRGVVDAQSDVYAVGATMFTLLSGEAVHVADTLARLLTSVVSEPARSLATVARRDIPRELVPVVDRALALDKAMRWRSAREMRAALRTYAPHVARVPTAPISAAPAPPTIPTAVETLLVPDVGERPEISFPPPPSGHNWQSTPGPISAAPSTPRVEEEVTQAAFLPFAIPEERDSQTAPVTPRIDFGAPTLRQEELSAIEDGPPSSEPTMMAPPFVPVFPSDRLPAAPTPIATTPPLPQPKTEHTLVLPQPTPRPSAAQPTPRPSAARPTPRARPTAPPAPETRPAYGPIVAILVVLGLIGVALFVASRLLAR